MKRALVIATFALAFAGSSWAFAQQAYARGPKNQDTLISMLATKFGKSPDEVRAVFIQFQTQNQTERYDAQTARLDQAVEDGKLTVAQKQLILDKLAQERKERSTEQEAWKLLSPEQRQIQMASRRARMDNHREELNAWAKSNSIDQQYVLRGQVENGQGIMGGTRRGMH